jgi:hypothetical protein
MSKGNTFEGDFLALIFHGTAIAGLAENDTSTPLTDLYASLHTGDPGEGGSQTTSETSYTGYTRIAVSRDSGGWTITGSSVSPASAITFPVCAGGSATITYAAVGTDFSGAGKLLWSGAVSPSIAVSTGVTPSLTTASTVVED